jgi:hypothetical protein
MDEQFFKFITRTVYGIDDIKQAATCILLSSHLSLSIKFNCFFVFRLPANCRLQHVIWYTGLRMLLYSYHVGLCAYYTLTFASG